MLRSFLLLVTACLSLTGCLSYSHHDLAQVKQWPLTAPAADAKPSVYVRLNGEYLLNDRPRAGGVDTARWEKILVDSYSASGAVASATAAKTQSDIYVSATLTNHEKGIMPLAFISGFTFTLIPATFDNTLTLKTVYKDRDGKVLGQVEKSETITTWIQLVLIFAAPFNASLDDTIKHLSQSSIEEAVRLKLL
ncbi:hypothetical protein AUC61_21960 [Pseudomonas sp. S25]|uniref:Lipoprotein n=1 Tax=Pseudomonas maioricensis TaxID=1766623 RepID=A0ABS9ZNR0_9PSED|nr:hypothetical protein [Pseudomonas sp. S25]MCI8212200.1 hypothetical protein [Pseudomonas sp. S25]